MDKDYIRDVLTLIGMTVCLVGLWAIFIGHRAGVLQ